MKTYVSLFSSAGVGCYGLKKNGFECVATNELLERRLNIQRINHKCRYDHGYIGGDITLEETQLQILNEIEFWKNNEGIKKLDVLMATPPCQGMSTANYKKGDEIDRNSLVVEAIHLVDRIKPRVFIFENVRAFLTTMCIDKDEETLSIKECIYKHLDEEYNIYAKVINFMDYGIPSSRPRTLVIGTRKDEKNFSPLNIFPLKSNNVTLRDAIGNLPSLNYGEKCPTDIYHSFRKYPAYMQEWIHDLKEGESAFKNSENKLPYKIDKDGNKQILKSGHMGNKFRRMIWNQPAPCITTRNDQLASQSTIHPVDDRVLSIRELMRVMSIPDDFKWVANENQQAVDNAETLIRQSIGEAVPTGIIIQVAKNIKDMIDFSDFIEGNYDFDAYRNTNNYYIKSYIYENELSDQNETGSFYTPQIVVYNTIKEFLCNSKNPRILEPAVGLGAFIPQFLRLVDECDTVTFDLVDTNNEALQLLSAILPLITTNNKFNFNYINDDFLTHNFNLRYDAIISNPPYFKMKAAQKNIYKRLFVDKASNIFCLFLDKYSTLSNEIMVVIPKGFLMIPDSNYCRYIYQMNYNIYSIYDYCVDFFKKVFIEIISIHFSTSYTGNVTIQNYRENIIKSVPQGYIYDDKIWLLYKNEWFINYKNNLKLDVFNFYRDRQLTNKYLSKDKKNIWVIRSKNLLDDGTFIHKEGYDRYIDNIDEFQLSKYYNKKHILFINFTYNTRAAILPDKCTVNGSFCILLPKTDNQAVNLNLYASENFRKYYAIVKNLSKFTLNVDANTIYYIGVERND